MYRLTDELRKRLKKPLGAVCNEFPSAKEIICVGDICSKNALLKGIEPKLMIYDNMVEREPSDSKTKEILNKWNVITLKVKNPAGTISEQAEKSIKLAIKSDGKYKIEVDGEEDLLALPCIINANNNTVVCYGQPGEGMVIVEINEDIKKDVMMILSKMEVGK